MQMCPATTKIAVDARAAERVAPSSTIQWNETAGVAARRMQDAVVAKLTVVADGRPIGHIRLEDIERCEQNGNWLEAIMVIDLVQRASDTCN